MTVVWTGLGSTVTWGHAPFDTDAERAAYRQAIRADLLRRGYTELDRQQGDDEAAE